MDVCTRRRCCRQAQARAPRAPVGTATPGRFTGPPSTSVGYGTAAGTTIGAAAVGKNAGYCGGVPRNMGAPGDTANGGRIGDTAPGGVESTANAALNAAAKTWFASGFPSVPGANWLCRGKKGVDELSQSALSGVRFFSFAAAVETHVSTRPLAHLQLSVERAGREAWPLHPPGTPESRGSGRRGRGRGRLERRSARRARCGAARRGGRHRRW